MKKTINKALGAAVGAAATALGVALSDGDLTRAELLVTVGGALLSFGAVWKLRYAVENDNAGPVD